MFIETIPSQGKYSTILLRESFREGGKVKHRTIANLSKCSEDEIEAIKLAFKHKKNLAEIDSINNIITLHQGLSVGAVLVIKEVAQRLGISDAFGSSREGKLALWQVIARVIDQGSRLSATRLAGTHACCDILGIGSFCEDHLYKNLTWISSNQDKVEDAIFRHLYSGAKPDLFLYDVTSSYLEGSQNELAAFGYNRDGKKGKQQIVVGLLCNVLGDPLSIEVFSGNTCDTKTFASQVRKAAERFGGGEVTFVGDRGMIKAKQIEELEANDFHHITGITKPQIEALLKRGIFQMNLFENALCEIQEKDRIRYILRRNPQRAKEVRNTRNEKKTTLLKLICKTNSYSQEHPKAKIENGVKKITEKAKRLKLKGWISIKSTDRTISLEIDPEVLKEEEKFDGCYVLKTDLEAEKFPKEIIHSRYKDLSLVERAFRTMKTGHLELHPVNVRLANNTRAHVFVAMLAYKITRELESYWETLNTTVVDGIAELTTLCSTEIHIKGEPRNIVIPVPRDSVKKLVDLAKVSLPKSIPSKGIKVSSRKKLQDQRKH